MPGNVGRSRVEGLPGQEPETRRELLQRQACELRHPRAKHCAALDDVFFLKGKPPENMTLHGAHDFNSGGEIGSVSAASTSFAAQIGKPFQRVVDTLTIG